MGYRRIVPSSATQGPTTTRGRGRTRQPYAAPPDQWSLSRTTPPTDLPLNLLPYASQAMESGEDWVPDFQVTSADRTTSVALDGDGSLAVTVTTAEGVIRYPNSGMSGVPVTPGEQITVMAWVRCDTDANWYAVIHGICWDSGGAGVAVTGSTVVDPIGQSTWQFVKNTFTVPATAAYAGIALNFGNIANGTVIYVDRAGMFRGDHGEDFFSYSGAPQTLEVSATATASGSVEASGVKSLAATATATASGSAAVSRVASLAAAATATAAGSADDNKIATLAATASATGAGSATASGVKPLAAAATATAGATGAVSRTAGIAATDTATAGATAAVSRSATLAADATATASGSADLTVASGAVSIAATAEATASATTDASRVASLAAEATATAAGSTTASRVASLAAEGSASASGSVAASVVSPVSLAAEATATAAATAGHVKTTGVAAVATGVGSGSAQHGEPIPGPRIAATPTVTAVATAGISGVYGLTATATARASAVDVFSRTYKVFSPESVEVQLGRPHALWYVGNMRGRTLIREGGVWKYVSNQQQSRYDAAERVYRGGRETPVDATQENELVAAGFGSGIKSVTD